MVLIDANLLIYAYDESSPYQRQARVWLETQFNDEPVVGLPWVSVLAFLRIVTHPNLPSPSSFTAASNTVDDWLAQDNVKLIVPGPRHWSILRTLSIDAQARGGFVTDAHLAALAIENGAALCTNDAGFRRFKGLRLLNPLAG